MRILLTGGDGFIGGHLKKFLSKNHEIFEVKRLKKNRPKNKNILYYDNNINDLLSFFNLHKPEIVVHLASLFISEHNVSDVSNLINDNILFSAQLVECAKKSECNNFLNTGTSWQNYNDKIYEPVNLYASTKEAFLKILYYYHIAHHINCITLKLFDSYGPNDKRKKLFYYLNSSKNDGILEMTKGLQMINILHVDDICAGFIKAIDLFKKDKSIFKTYALSALENISLKDLVQKYIEINNLSLKINWGGKKYKEREVIIPWSKYQILPNWKPLVSLEKGLRDLNFD